VSPRPGRTHGEAARAGLLAAALAAWALAPAALPGVAAAARNRTEVDTRLNPSTIEPGGVVSLLVTVTDPGGSVVDPQFGLPPGLELLGSSRSQQFSWVNGRSTNVISFRFEIAASRPGRYTIGPLRVSVGGQVYKSGEETLNVAAAARSAPRPVAGRPRQVSTASVASLVLSLEPSVPVVGQACRLRVQLIQRVDMSEDSDYDPPATAGFWSETWSDMRRSQGREGSRNVIVTESSVRVYPLSPGPAVITPARGIVTPSGGGLPDPLGSLVGSPVKIVSESLRVGVRPLPPHAPAAFDGAVGSFELSWSADRSHTTQDQAITARLDVRGAGNQPLLRAPAYAPADFDVFASTVEDSLPRAGVLGSGRRSFLWTLLPRRAGHLRISAPTLAWYDPGTSRYLTTTPAPLDLEVLSARPGSETDEDADGLPSVFRSHPARPGGRTAWPPLALMGGALVALGVSTRRRSRRPDPGAADRARLREWLRAVGLARGSDFWRTADEVTSWLVDRGEQVKHLRETIAMARYAGRTDEEENVRRTLIERIAASIPEPPPRWPLQVAAVLLGIFGLTLAGFSVPERVTGRLVERARAADARARAGDVPAAEAEWARLWEEAPGDPALAARLAWGALTRDDVAAATVWVLRGDRREARDPALRAMATRVRDAGGLVGAPARALPLRSLEWAVLAFALAAAAGLAWHRRPLGVALAAAAFAAGAWWPIESTLRSRQDLAVVRASVPLPPTGVTLDSGQVVRVTGQSEGGVDVRAASDLEGRLPSAAVWRLGRI